MRSSAFLLFGLLCWQVAAPAQTINDNVTPDECSGLCVLVLAPRRRRSERTRSPEEP